MLIAAVAAAVLVVAAAATMLTKHPGWVALVGAALASAIVLANLPRETTSEDFEGPAWLAAAIVAVPGFALWLSGIVLGLAMSRVRRRRSER